MSEAQNPIAQPLWNTSLFYKPAVEHAPLMVFVKDEQDRITYANIEAHRRAGLQGEEWMGVRWRDLIQCIHQEDHAIDDIVLSTGVSNLEHTELVLMGGSQYWMSVSRVPWKDAQSGHQGIIVYMMDITENLGLEDALQSYNSELLERNEELDEFTHIASHDLRDPLRKILSFSQHLQKDLGSDLNTDAKEDLNIIMRSARQMEQLIHDLLVLTGARRRKFQPQPVDLDACVDAALENLDLAWKESRAQIIRTKLPSVMGSQGLLIQVFQNLIGNAIKYNEAPIPIVEVSAKTDHHRVRIFVRDNGIGIPPEYREVVFKPFKRLQLRSRYEGSGIGLTIVHKIVERHRGRIWVGDPLAGGAEFIIELPQMVP
jgi:PAS domain S-box-containing protein